jgi:hypothetical protein
MEASLSFCIWTYKRYLFFRAVLALSCIYAVGCADPSGEIRSNNEFLAVSAEQQARLDRVNRTRELIREHYASGRRLTTESAGIIIEALWLSRDDDPLRTQFEEAVPLYDKYRKQFDRALRQWPKDRVRWFRDTMTDVAAEVIETDSTADNLAWRTSLKSGAGIDWRRFGINPAYGSKVTTAATKLVGHRRGPVNRRSPMCYRWVKKILHKAALIRSVADLPGRSAKVSAQDLVATGLFIPMGLTHESQALPGNVCVYSGKRWHIEVVGTDGARYSEFKQRGPATAWGRKFEDCFLYGPSLVQPVISKAEPKNWRIPLTAACG